MTDDGGVIRRLLPRVQPYAWGSHTAMTELLHIASTGGPMAELWLGDHPLLPSNVATTAEEHETLDQILTGDIASWFDSASRQHGTSLSFLLKVMAIAEPLSLQTHPDLAQAQAGFAREDALGIERTAPNRNYRDANHKPELICALTEMDALSGFRRVEETLVLLRLVDDPSARLLATSLARGLGAALSDGLNGAIFPDAMATDSFATASRNAALKHPEHGFTFAWWAALCDRHPGDGGIAVAALLHCVRLQPGQALFLGAGNMHAYLSGVGIEIMANSDNVLRGGLTPKHVDIEELLVVTRAESGEVPMVAPVDVSSTLFNIPTLGAHTEVPNHDETDNWIAEEWPVPVDDFRLLRFHGHSSSPANLTLNTRPVIVLCTQGEVCLSQGGLAITLRIGESAIAGNSTDSLAIAGTGTLFLASAG